MDEKKVLGSVADTILDKPFSFSVDVLKQNFFQKLFKKKDKQTFEVTGLTLGTMIKISKELLAINPKEKWDNNNLLNSNYQLIEDNGYRMAKIIATAVVNKKEDASQKLINFFLHNLTAKELLSLVTVIIKKMDVVSFMSSIISVKGLNLLEMSRQTTEGIIASGQQSEVL